MKLRRDISGQELVKALRILGYTPTRQIGSHVRLTTQQKGEHHITIPNHDPIRIGTFSAIISDIALHFGSSKEDIIKDIWG